MTEETKEGIKTLRNLILEAAKPESREIEFFGQMIELRQPPVDVMLATNAEEMQDDRAHMVVHWLINYAYEPGTDNLIFSEPDVQILRRLPFGPDIQRLMSTVTELTTLDVDAAGNG